MEVCFFSPAIYITCPDNGGRVKMIDSSVYNEPKDLKKKKFLICILIYLD